MPRVIVWTRSLRTDTWHAFRSDTSNLVAALHPRSLCYVLERSDCDIQLLSEQPATSTCMTCDAMAESEYTIDKLEE